MLDRENSEIENKYLAVLHDIESAILDVYYEQKEMTDYSVEKVINALTRDYNDEATGRKPVPFQPNSPLDGQLYAAVQKACDFWLGKVPGTEADPTNKKPAEIVVCLKRISRSLKLWNKEGGRRGYLNYISEFVK